MKKKNSIFWILIMGTLLATCKCIFVSLQMDEEYAISLPYRLLLGDRLFTQIWDPHQTSAFPIQFLMWLFIKLTGSTTYVVIWIRFAGVLIHAAVACYLYRFLCKITNKQHSFYFALLYFNLLPKTYVMPEFSNMMVWGLTMLLIAMTRLMWLQEGEEQPGQNRKTIITLIEIGFWICFMVLSYPSCLLMYPFVMACMWFLQKNKGKNMAIITAVCGVCGGAYLGYLLSYMTIGELLENLKSLVASCGSHSDTVWYKLALYTAGICVGILFLLAYRAVTELVYRIYCNRKGLDSREKSETCKITKMLLLLMVAFILQGIHWILMLWEYESSYPFTVYFCIFAFAISCYKQTKGQNSRKDKIFLIWLFGNLTMYVAILMLTNLTIFTSVKYLMPGVIMGMIRILSYAKERAPHVYQRFAMPLILIWCLVATFVKGWAYTDDDGLMKNITCVRNVISEGPGKGIFTEYMQGYMQESIYEEMQQYVKPKDRLLVIDSHTLCYLYQDVQVASSITICTPTFDENLLVYWDRNPQKYPNVVAIRCWYGEIKWETEGWLMNWLEEEYQAESVIDGKYFRYYIK